MKERSERRTFHKRFGNALDRAFAMVSDPMAYPTVHPLIAKVVKLDAGTFRCYETVLLVFIPYSFSYEVKVSSPRPHHARMESEVQKGVYLLLDFTCTEDGMLTEDVTVRGPWLYRKMLLRKITDAHGRMLENIGRILTD